MITLYHTADLLMFCEHSGISLGKFPIGVIKTLDFVIVKNIVLQKHFVSYPYRYPNLNPSNISSS